MPAYHSGNLSKTGRPDFNYPLRPTTKDLTVPLGPRNMMVTAPYKIGATDIRWDNPKLIPQNSGLNILGVNVYRSINNPYGPYEKVSDTPVGVLFYRDESQEQLITEDVTATLQYSTEPDAKWRVWAQHRPIVHSGSNGTTTDNIQDVIVEIDDGSGTFVEVPAFTLSGKTGEVILISNPTYNQDVEQIIPPRLPWPPGGKVKLTYRYLKHSVLSRLSQRIFYKVTTVAVNPSDNSLRIETPIEEVEWRSTADIEEIDWIWREAILRNRWILEQGGESAKVFVRKWMGEKCPCYEDSHGQSRGDCETCFPAGTEITMGDFTRKSIELIQKGNKILTHKGNVKEVSETMSRDINEELIEINSIHKIKITPTKDHPLLIIKKEDARCKRCTKMTCTGFGTKIYCKGKAESGYWKNDCNRTIVDKIRWIKADEVEEGDYLIFPIPKGESEEFTIPELKFMGYYAAEGWTAKRDNKKGGMTKEDKRVLFGFNKNEIDTCIKELKECAKKFGHKININKTSSGENGVSITVSSVDAVKLVLLNLGKYSDKKQASFRLVWQSPINLLNFLGTYLNGDGYQCFNRTSTKIGCSSASYQMIRQIQIMLMRCGIVSNFISRTRMVSNPLRPGFHKTTSYELIVGKSYMSLLADYSFYKKQKVMRSGQCFLNSGFVFYPVKNINKIKHKGKVYNLEVKDDNSYIANGVAVHNCFGTSIIGGYSGPFEILIAPPEAEKTIDLLDMGLHIRYDYMTWAGPFPIINERDVIVRQSNERYLVGPVNYQGSKGAIYQQHFTISYVDEGDIRYEIGVPGGQTTVPESTDLYREESSTPGQPLKTPASPVIPLKPEIPRDKIMLGKSVSWENITY